MNKRNDKYIEYFVENYIKSNIKSNVLLENYDDKMKNLMSKIRDQSEETYKLDEAGTINLNVLNEYEKVIKEMNEIIDYHSDPKLYEDLLEKHIMFHGAIKDYHLKEMVMTTNDIDFLKELMKDERPFVNELIPHNPNATPEMLRELSKKFGDTMAIVEHPNTPIDLLKEYCSNEYYTDDVNERAIKRIQERQQDSINVIENFLQDLNKEDVVSSMANVNLNNTNPITNLNERINHVKESLNDLSSDNKEIYTNKVLNAVKEFNKEILNKGIPEPEHNYDFER